jgi:hypothetical protein
LAGSSVNAQTVHLKLAQELLGHSSFGVTADIYTHVEEDGQRDAASVNYGPTSISISRQSVGYSKTAKKMEQLPSRTNRNKLEQRNSFREPGFGKVYMCAFLSFTLTNPSNWEQA